MNNQNIFPPLGKVAIVDDEIDEVKQLMQYLSSRSIPYLYYTGRENEFPKENKKPIQFIFLDLFINVSNNSKNLASTLVSNIRSLIPKNNGPYILAIWSQNYTKNEEEIKKAIDDLENKPEDWFYLDKSSLIQSDKFYDELTAKMISSFKKNSLVNLLNVCSEHFQSNLSNSFYLFNDSILRDVDGDKKLSVLLNYVLKDECPFPIKDLTKKERSALFLPLFEQIITSYSKGCDTNSFSLPPNLIHKKEETELDTFSYNKIIHISHCSRRKEPKTVYKSNERQLVHDITNYCKSVEETEIIPIEIDITHLCTAAHKKSKFRTMVQGFLLNYNSKYRKIAENKHNPSDYVYNVGNFYYNNDKFLLIIFCDKLKSKSVNSLHAKDAIFKISTKWYRSIRFAIAYLLGKSS